jgi:dolichyl-phosphate beta-glucosyltransferase
MRLSVVIPAYNEARRLPATLERVVGFLGADAGWQPAEVLVVDDGSADGTAAVVDVAPAAEGVTVVCLGHRVNRGKGAAVRTGFAAARGEAILLCDADLSTPIEEVDRLQSALTDGVAVGSRALDRERIELRQPLYRDLMGRVFNLAVRILAVPGVSDTQCGFKLFAGDHGRRCAEAQRLDGFAFDVELLYLTRAWRREVVEVPVRWRHVEESRVQPVRHSLDMFVDLLRVGWWRLTRHPSATIAGRP